MSHTMATLLSSGKGRGPRLTDFVLRWARKRQTAQEQLDIFRALAARFDSKD